jgi:hypothetical protein
MFAELEDFMRAHQPCGDVEADVGEETVNGHHVAVTCACGEAFERWVSVETASEDLLRSRLSAFEN